MNWLEYENSSNILERQEYAKQLKIHIDYLSQMTEFLEQDSESVMLDKQKHLELIKKLKTKLSEYDVYLQNQNYKCNTCNETPCVCKEINF